MVSDIYDKGPMAGVPTSPVTEDIPPLSGDRLVKRGENLTLGDSGDNGQDGKGNGHQLDTPENQIDLQGASNALGDFLNIATLFFKAMQEMKQTERSERQMYMDKAYQQDMESIEQKKTAAAQQMLGAFLSFGANIVGNVLTIAIDGISIFSSISKALSPVGKELGDVAKEAEDVIKQVTEELELAPKDLNQVSDEMKAVQTAVKETMEQTYKEVGEGNHPNLAREAAIFAGKKTANEILKGGYEADLAVIGEDIKKELPAFLKKRVFKQALKTVRDVFAEKGLDISAKVSKGFTTALGTGVGQIEEAGAKQTDVDADRKKAEADKTHAKERIADDLANEYNDNMQTIKAKMDEMIQSQNKAREAAARI